MARHALGAGDGHFVGDVRAERFLDRERFDAVVDLRAGAVGVDVVDVGRVLAARRGGPSSCR